MSQQRKYGISEQNETSRFILIPKWLGIAVLVLLLLACLLLLMLWKPWYPAQRPVSVEAPVIETSENKDKSKDYQFYDLLPQQTVTPLPSKSLESSKVKDKPDASNVKINTEKKPEPALSMIKTENVPTIKQQGVATIQTTEKDKVKFIVDVQRFDNSDDAEQLRDKMIRADVSSEVAVHIENDKVWYRVLSGPYDTQVEAFSAQKRLTEHQIQSRINRVPDER